MVARKFNIKVFDVKIIFWKKKKEKRKKKKRKRKEKGRKYK